ncbi:MAG: hypothetical protein ACI9FN_001612 [Saprospiraceae bacterium]
MQKILVLLACLIFSQCSNKNIAAIIPGESSESLSKKVPVMSFVEQRRDLGEMQEGSVKEVVYEFVNSGTSDLRIELVTACKCTEIKWPIEPIAPGGHGTIIANFDSSGMEGPYTKTLDIIANTYPIVVEVKFSVVVKR